MAEFKAAVRSLCELVATEGALDSRFLPAVSGQQGILAQKRYQNRQREAVEREAVITGVWREDDDELVISGRIDGLCETDPAWLEEIKTLKVSSAQIPESARQLHWAQLTCYGYLWCQREGQEAVTLTLTYLDKKAQVEAQYHRDYFHDQVQKEQVEQWFSRYLAWLKHYQQLSEARDASVAKLNFPFLPFRPGQRKFAASVYQTIEHNQQLLVEAPTGIGKTMAALYPAIRQLGNKIDKVVYLTAKNSTQSLPVQAAGALTERGGRLRTIVLTGKQRSCLNPGSVCQSSCLYAANFYTQLQQLAPELLQQQTLDYPALAAYAKQHSICPYYLAMFMAPWFDLVVADYNYGLDGEGSMSWLMEATGSRYALLVDEAHNVVERARSLYSAQISRSELKWLAKETLPEPVARRLRSVRTQLTKLINAQEEIAGELVELTAPESLLRALRLFSETVETQLAQGHELSEPLMECYFSFYRFIERSDCVGTHYQYQLLRQPRDEVVKLACMDVAPELETRFDAAAASVFFSATLKPLQMTARLMGLADEHYEVVLPSPYPPERQGVWLLPDIDTRYRHRQQSYQPLATLIAAQFAEHPGNHLVFFPSFAYLAAVAELLPADLPVILQQSLMNDQQRAEFIEELASLDEPKIGLAVLGGIFSEGIDLPGQQLESVVVVGVGLAQFNVENEALRNYFSEQQEDGFALTYLYPAMQRVIQAAGRVIRSASDCGTVIFADNRYLRPEYQSLLPPHWQLRVCRSRELANQLHDFWLSMITEADEPSRSNCPSALLPRNEHSDPV